MRERDQSLSVQMEALSKRQAVRDKRRMESRLRSAAEREREGGGPAGPGGVPQGRGSANATGGLSLGRSAAEAVAEAAALSQSVTVYHCELCQVSYKAESQYQMHLASATHRKAVVKADEDRQRALRGGAAAEAAMAAAGWQNRMGQAAAPTAGHDQPTGEAAWRPVQQQHHHHHHQQQQQQGGRGRGRGGPVQPPAAPARTHADVVRELKAQAGSGPLDLDGWVPPSVPMPLATFDADAKARAGKAGSDSESASEDGGEEEGKEEEAKVGVKEEEAKPPGGSAEGGNPLAALVGGYSDSDGSSSSEEEEDEPAEMPPGTSFF